MGGGDSRLGEHFGNKSDAFAEIIAIETEWNNFLKKCVRTLGDTTAWFSCCRVAINLPSGRVGRFFVDTGLPKGDGIRIRGVAAPVVDVDRMIRNGGIQIGDAERAAFVSFCVVVFEAENPFTRRDLRSTLSERCLNGRDGT